MAKTWNTYFRENFVQETRDYSPPAKIYIQGKGTEQEISEYEPIDIKDKINDLLYGKYSYYNFIELFYSVPEVFAPVHEIAKRVSDAVWQLRRENNDEIDFDNAFFNKLFSQPNFQVTSKDLIYQSVCYEILTGKIFWHFYRPNEIWPDWYKNVVSWWCLPSQAVTAIAKDNIDPYTCVRTEDYMARYEMSFGRGTKKFKPEDVVSCSHANLFDPTDINQSKPLILGAHKAIKNLIAVYEARGVIYIKRGALGFMVSKKSDESGMQSLTKLEKEQAIKDFDDTYGLTGKKSPIGVTSVPVEFIRTAMSIAELEPFKETDADASAIYAVLRVPGHLKPGSESTRANADTDMKAFYTDTIIPWAKRYAELWTAKLGFKHRYIQPDYSHISFLQINRKEKSTVDKIDGSIWLERWSHSVCCLNEWIVAIGGEKGTGRLYEEKMLDLNTQELEQVAKIIQLNKTNNAVDNGTQPKVKDKASGAEA